MAIVHGLRRVQAALRAAGQIGAGDELVRRLYYAGCDAADLVMAEAIELAPIKWGDLRGSAANNVRVVGGEMVAEIFFGGLATEYAEYQHDHEDLNHPKGGRSHFLVGRSWSAWETKQAAAARVFNREAGIVADEFIQRAINGSGGDVREA